MARGVPVLLSRQEGLTSPFEPISSHYLPSTVFHLPLNVCCWKTVLARCGDRKGTSGVGLLVWYEWSKYNPYQLADALKLRKSFIEQIKSRLRCPWSVFETFGHRYAWEWVCFIWSIHHFYALCDFAFLSRHSVLSLALFYIHAVCLVTFPILIHRAQFASQSAFSSLHGQSGWLQNVRTSSILAGLSLTSVILAS